MVKWFSLLLQLKSEFGNKKFMVWTTVRSQSSFCWLYRASPSSAAKNIINMISVLTIWWCPSVESSLMLLEEGVCYDQSILLLASVLLHFVLQGQTCPLFQVSLDFPLLYSSPLWWKGHLFFFFGVSSSRSYRSSQNHSASASSALMVGTWTWITVILNGLPWKWTEIILSFLRLHPSTAFGLFCWLWGLLHFF